MGKKKKISQQAPKNKKGSFPPGRRINIFIILLCAFAGFRIFLYSAAFPVFNNVDEQLHFDVVYKYASGHIPEKLDHFSKETIDLIVAYDSPEYLNRPGDFFKKGEIPPPRWLPSANPEYEHYNRIYKETKTKHWQTVSNYESTQPPVYYVFAALWYKLGKFLGLSGGNEIYWIRFLNVPIYVFLVWLSYFYVKRLFPDNAFLIFSLPFFLSVFPQSIMFGINNDVLSPLIFSLAFFCLVEIHIAEEKSFNFYLLTGFFIALAFLTKTTNLAILAALGVVLAIKIKQIKTSKNIQAELLKIFTIVLSATLPIALWLGRNYFILNDITGSTDKIRYLGWTLKPLSEIWDHPFFSIQGILTFWNDLLATFWRGEFYWYKAKMASDVFDAFYSISSFMFIGVSIASIFFIRKEYSKERFLHLMSILIVTVSVVFLLIVSLAYDFHDCWYPSRFYPFVTSGRLILGILVPFLMLYLGGFNDVVLKLKLQPLREAILILIAITIAASEFIISYPVFKSSYNWFHIMGFVK